MFTVYENHIEIPDLKSFFTFCRFHPGQKAWFLHDVTLLQDLVTPTGAHLFPKGITFTHDHIARLAKFHQNNPKINFQFVIERKQKLILAFHKHIENDFKNLLINNATMSQYRKFVGNTTKHIERFVEDLLSSENLVMLLYRLKITAEQYTDSLAKRLYTHAMNVAFACSGVLVMKYELGSKPVDPDAMRNILMASFLHNLGALVNCNEVLKQPQNKQFAQYTKLCSKTLSLLEDVELSDHIKNILLLYYGFFCNTKDFLHTENDVSLHANILLVADTFCRKEAGLFTEQKIPEKILDELNVHALQGVYNSNVVQLLTSTLSYDDIFDFYVEMERLKCMCPFGVARPYPMTGVRSPVVFLCRDYRVDCEHLESNIKAINLVEKQEDLEKGSYSRCRLATKHLAEFYEKHYQNIKDSAWDKVGIKLEKKGKHDHKEK